MLDQNTLVNALHRFIGLGGEDKGRNAKSKSRIGEFVLEGKLERGVHARYSVGGEDFEIGDNTWVVGRINEGLTVRVKGTYRNSGRYATRILVLE